MQLDGLSAAERRRSVLAGSRLTSTGLERRKKESIEAMALAMGAQWSDELRSGTTHLVAASVLSAKFASARERALRIVRPEWVEECHATALRLGEDRYEVPALQGVVVACTNLGSEDRLLVKEAVEALGGAYAGSLEKGKTTHLVCDEPWGDKFDHATEWGVPIAGSEWIDACTEAGQLVDPAEYRPTRAATLAAEVLDSARVEWDTVAREVEESELFRPCRFCVEGGPETTSFAVCLRLVNRGKGVVYPEFYPGTTSHVIVLPEAEPLSRSRAARTYATDKHPSLAIVTVAWLAASLKAGRLLPAGDFAPRWRRFF